MVIIRNCNGNCLQDRCSLKNGRRYNSQHSVSNPSQSRQRRCCPYEFDRNICKVLDDRVLCGYNKNIGLAESKDSVVELHGGCRLRGDRLECGYHDSPYINSRRPPFDDNNDVPHTQKYTVNDLDTRPTRNPFDAVTRCVAMDDRIVCRNV